MYVLCGAELAYRTYLGIAGSTLFSYFALIDQSDPHSFARAELVSWPFPWANLPAQHSSKLFHVSSTVIILIHTITEVKSSTSVVRYFYIVYF